LVDFLCCRTRDCRIARAALLSFRFQGRSIWKQSPASSRRRLGEIPRAAKVAARIREQLSCSDATEVDRHVIHLGDVYYAGRGFEFDARLADPWPVTHADATSVRPIGSWCLPGNHDMFAGGQAYFEFLARDARFKRQNGCSHFALENDDWLLLGIDSAFTLEGLKGDVGALATPQAEWFAAQVERAPNKKLILLSHHQPFSAWEAPSPKMVSDLGPILCRARLVEAWFWGHEHRCAVYEPVHNIKYPALIGHGGVPVYSSKTKPKNFKLRHNDTRSFSHLLENYSYMGFAVVDLDGPVGKVRYVDEDGFLREGVDEIA
jgi:3',5'-cyclic AMP phosphodiesterase CpdA